MSKIDELKQEIDEQREMNKKSHSQSKIRIVGLERKCSSLKNEVSELRGEKADIEELMERMDNMERGLQNLWNAFKGSQNQKAG